MSAWLAQHAFGLHFERWDGRWQTPRCLDVSVNQVRSSLARRVLWRSVHRYNTS